MPTDIYCCGFAGDRGFNFPELNASALKNLKDQVSTCEAGYSTSKTCEIGLSLHGGIPYRSILYLVDAASRARSL
jgi:D-lactate dehydrogenase